jgi:pimeloyl-ACP methyl ester carboxylesterase
VLVAGTAAWGGIWHATIPALAAAGYRVLTVDLPPFGYSTRPRSPADYGTAAQGARLAAALAALRPGPVTLVAHSFGARATLDAAARLGPALAGLVLIDGALGLAAETRETPQPAVARWALASPPVREALVAATITNRRATAALTRRLVAPGARLDPATLAALRAPFAIAGTTAAVGEWLPQFLAEPARAAPEARRRYATLVVPTLIVWGARDVITPLAEGRAQAATFPGARLVVLPGVGHIPAIEAPGPLAAVLLDALGARAQR